MTSYVTFSSIPMFLGGVTASDNGWVAAHPQNPYCNCVAYGNFFVPSGFSCRDSYTQCYNNGTCACVNAPPPNGGAAPNQQHVYNAINAIGF
jgi:hypothetical protein